jgi:hypothetical protein
MSEAAMLRTVDYADGWFLLQVTPPRGAEGKRRLAELAGQRGRPKPNITASSMVVLDGDPLLPDKHDLQRRVSDPDGMFGIPPDLIPTLLIAVGTDALAGDLAEYAAAGATRVVVTVAAGD